QVVPLHSGAAPRWGSARGGAASPPLRGAPSRVPSAAVECRAGVAMPGSAAWMIALGALLGASEVRAAECPPPKDAAAVRGRVEAAKQEADRADRAGDLAGTAAAYRVALEAQAEIDCRTGPGTAELLERLGWAEYRSAQLG